MFISLHLGMLLMAQMLRVRLTVPLAEHIWKSCTCCRRSAQSQSQNVEMITSWAGQVARYWRQHVHKVSEHLLLEAATRIFKSRRIGESACAAVFGISDTTDALRLSLAVHRCRTLTFLDPSRRVLYATYNKVLFLSS